MVDGFYFLLKLLIVFNCVLYWFKFCLKLIESIIKFLNLVLLSIGLLICLSIY